MKRIVFVLVLACLVMAAAFAQAKPAAPAAAGKSNAVALDLFPLFKGIIMSNTEGNNDFTVFDLSIAYERLIAPHFSIGPDIDFGFIDLGNVDAFYFSLAAEARFYPLANFDKFFLGATLGFNSLSVDGEKADAEHGGFAGLIVSLKTGYKLVLKDIVYIEPSIAYVLAEGESPVLGWNGGLRFGVTF